MAAEQLWEKKGGGEKGEGAWEVVKRREAKNGEQVQELKMRLGWMSRHGLLEYKLWFIARIMTVHMSARVNLITTSDENLALRAGYSTVQQCH